jgi:hypothetical protein
MMLPSVNGYHKRKHFHSSHRKLEDGTSHYCLKNHNWILQMSNLLMFVILKFSLGPGFIRECGTGTNSSGSTSMPLPEERISRIR